MYKSEENSKTTNIFSSSMSHLKSYFKHKPTSQVCLDFQQALLIDANHANFMEVILNKSFIKLNTQK